MLHAMPFKGCQPTELAEGCRARRRQHAAVAVWALLAVLVAGAWAAATAGAAPVDEAAAIAEADPRVATVIAGAAATKKTAAWGDNAGRPAGATIVYTWTPQRARSVTARWPLLRTGATGVPTAPYVPVEHRLRLDRLTRVRVDVLLEQRRVIQILPMAGDDSEFKLLEETWAPFSWVGWFTARPWILAPVFIAFGVVIVGRAWRRSRAWSRRTPAMTRHDRQFIARLAVILFMAAGLLTQVYAGYAATQTPSVDFGPTFTANDLAALPMLLFPPGLFLAALILEFSTGVHRVAWGLVAVLAAAGSAYNLVSATFGTAGNLNITYYILLALLALLTAPRAFSAGRTGWSRHGMPSYS